MRGKLLSAGIGGFLSWDHPRGCGENSQFPAQISRASGSPPRMRGKRNICTLREDHNGITPADAGKTNPNPRGRSVGEDHPRGCGENKNTPNGVPVCSGSPPQVRGKLAVLGFFAASDGITPAGAGKTAMGDNKRMTQRDHPRRCGENPPKSSSATRQQGSPPQVRGKRVGRHFCKFRHGITPAGAGKTKTQKWITDNA